MPADVLVHRHPVLGRPALEHAPVVGGRAVAEEVPGRLDERVHRVGVAPGLAAAGRTARVDEARHPRQRRPALPADLHVLGQHHREVLLPLRHHAARVAVEDRDRSAPVALATDAPVPETVVDLGLSPARARPASRSPSSSPRPRVSPSRKPELIFTPSPVYACVSSQSGGRFTVATIGSPCSLAKSQSRWSSPGTAMMAPVP